MYLWEQQHATMSLNQTPRLWSRAAHPPSTAIIAIHDDGRTNDDKLKNNRRMTTKHLTAGVCIGVGIHCLHRSLVLPIAALRSSAASVEIHVVTVHHESLHGAVERSRLLPTVPTLPRASSSDSIFSKVTEQLTTKERVFFLCNAQRRTPKLT